MQLRGEMVRNYRKYVATFGNLTVYLHRFLRFFSVPFGSVLGGFWGVFCTARLFSLPGGGAVGRGPPHHRQGYPGGFAGGRDFGVLCRCFRVAFGLLSGVRLHALAYAVACAGGW